MEVEEGMRSEVKARFVDTKSISGTHEWRVVISASGEEDVFIIYHTDFGEDWKLSWFSSEESIRHNTNLKEIELFSGSALEDGLW